jgi:UDP-N-acetylglucosamine/UDP-N-acetylgalactosamine diphosphorylase
MDELRNKLAAHGQEHLLAHWDRLSADERATLARQIGDVDFGLMQRLVAGESKADDWAALAARAKSPRSIRLGRVDNKFSEKAARERGATALRNGNVGAMLVAGGQGTRLGFDHPKGMYPLGTVSNAYLFQILFEKLIAVGRRYDVTIPLFLMTSPATHDETVAFLDEHDRFGMRKEDLVVFCQGTMPAVDERTGKLLLASPGELALSPDGHGGMLAAFAKSTAPQIVRDRGLRQLFYFQVDNPLAQVCDEATLGYHLLADAEVTMQAVRKHDPAEKVGVVVDVDGRMMVIEYSDLPKEHAERRAADDTLELWAGSIAVHVFDADFLLRMSAGDGQLPFHKARKKVSHVDPSGSVVEPKEPNALKFEKFIFDLAPAAKNGLVVEVDPAEAFAPLKNEPGAKTDSPEWVRKQMIAQATRWLEKAGAKVAPGTPVEISPLVGYDAETVAANVKPGTVIDKATYLCGKTMNDE